MLSNLQPTNKKRIPSHAQMKLLSDDSVFGFNDPYLSDYTICFRADDTPNKSPDVCTSLDDNGWLSNQHDNSGEENVFHVSSLLLAKQSVFFHTLFCSCVAVDKRIVLTVTNAELALCGILLRVAYGGVLSGHSYECLTVGNICSLVQMANRFQLDDINNLVMLPYLTSLAKTPIDVICILDTLTPAIVASYFVDDKYKCICNVMLKYVNERGFVVFSRSFMFRSLSIAVLKLIIGSPDLIIDSEHDVLCVTLKWMAYQLRKQPARKAYLTATVNCHLVPLIRFQCMTTVFMRYIINFLPSGLSAINIILDVLCTRGMSADIEMQKVLALKYTPELYSCRSKHGIMCKFEGKFIRQNGERFQSSPERKHGHTIQFALHKGGHTGAYLVQKNITHDVLMARITEITTKDKRVIPTKIDTLAYIGGEGTRRVMLNITHVGQYLDLERLVSDADEIHLTLHLDIQQCFHMQYPLIPKNSEFLL
jgi:hypothetical protein